jgi:hypothetical protein
MTGIGQCSARIFLDPQKDTATPMALSAIKNNGKEPSHFIQAPWLARHFLAAVTDVFSRG